MKTMNLIALTLLIIGGLNWGLVGLFDFDLIAAVFGIDSIMSNLVYVLVGLAAVYSFYFYSYVKRPTPPATVRHA